VVLASRLFACLLSVARMIAGDAEPIDATHPNLKP
jgi:hypothetical protein